MANIRERAALAQLNALTKEVADAKKKAFGGKPQMRHGTKVFVLPGKAEQTKLKDLENKRKIASAKLDKERKMAKSKTKKELQAEESAKRTKERQARLKKLGQGKTTTPKPTFKNKPAKQRAKPKRKPRKR